MCRGRAVLLTWGIVVGLTGCDPAECEDVADDDSTLATDDDTSEADDDDATSDDAPLTVSSADPPRNDVAVPTGTSFRVEFSRAVDPTTLTSDTVVMVAHQTGFRELVLDYDAEAAVLVVTPSAPLLPGERVRLTFTTGVRDERGAGISVPVDGADVYSGYTLSYRVETPTAGATLEALPSWSSAELDRTITVRFGDVDRDGWLDAVAASGEEELEDPARMYHNTGGVLESAAAWAGGETALHFGVDLGDVDRDGWLDAAFAKRDGRTVLYLNNGHGTYPVLPTWRSATQFISRSLAFGDVDNDGWLDLAVANTYADVDGEHTVGFNEVFRNLGGALEHEPSWVSEDDRFSRSVVWSDINGDGLLDLCFSNMWEGQTVYYNRGGSFPPVADWQSADADQSRYIAVEDLDRDGWPDMVAANEAGHAKIYFNLGGTLEESASWESGQYRKAVSVVTGDLDGDGWPDLVFGHSWESTEPFDGEMNTNTVYLGQGGTFATEPDWRAEDHSNSWGLDLGDVDGDGDLDLLTGERNVGVMGVPNGLFRSLP